MNVPDAATPGSVGEPSPVACVHQHDSSGQLAGSAAMLPMPVHMDGDLLCLPAAVALLRTWLNRSEAICSRYRARNWALPTSVILAWIWVCRLHTWTTNAVRNKQRAWLQNQTGVTSNKKQKRQEESNRSAGVVRWVSTDMVAKANETGCFVRCLYSFFRIRPGSRIY